MTDLPANLRICIADDELDRLANLRLMLTSMGHEILSESTDGRSLVECCRRYQPDLAVTDVVMPNLDGIRAASMIYQDRPIPLIVVSAYDDAEYYRRASREHVFAYLVKPINHGSLAAAITIALARFDELRQVEKESIDLRNALQDRKTIERAKGVMMRDWGLSEQEAFSRLKHTARSGNQRMIDVARTILLASGVAQNAETRRGFVGEE